MPHASALGSNRATPDRRPVRPIGRKESVMDPRNADRLAKHLSGRLPRRAVLRRLGGGGLAAGGGLILGRAPVRAQTDDLEANKVLARRFHDEIFELGNLAVADEILTPDFVWYSPPQTTFVVG